MQLVWFELVSPCPFPTIITITPRPPPKIYALLSLLSYVILVSIDLERPGSVRKSWLKGKPVVAHITGLPTYRIRYYSSSGQDSIQFGIYVNVEITRMRVTAASIYLRESRSWFRHSIETNYPVTLVGNGWIQNFPSLRPIAFPRRM